MVATDQAVGRVLGVPLCAVTEQGLLDRVSDAVATRRPTVFVGVYAAMFRLAARDPQWKTLLTQSSNYPDGAGVVSELHRRGRGDAERVALTDFVAPLMAAAAREGWRVGLYGGRAEVLSVAAARLVATYPSLQVVLVVDGYGPVPTAEDVREADLDVLLVGIGAPRQEQWAHSVGVEAGVPALLTAGGLFDHVAGVRRRAPLMVQRAGMEWAWRVMLEPRRLLVRYVLGNGYFLWRTRQERASGAR